MRFTKLILPVLAGLALVSATPALPGDVGTASAQQFCGDCVTFGFNDHAFMSTGTCSGGLCLECFTDSGSGCHTNVMTGNCYIHFTCAGGYVQADPALTKLRQVVASGEGDALRRLLRQYPQGLTLNPTRSALQVSNCKGAVVAHVPLSKTLMRKLVSAAT